MSGTCTQDINDAPENATQETAKKKVDGNETQAKYSLQ